MGPQFFTIASNFSENRYQKSNIKFIKCHQNRSRSYTTIFLSSWSRKYFSKSQRDLATMQLIFELKIHTHSLWLVFVWHTQTKITNIFKAHKPITETAFITQFAKLRRVEFENCTTHGRIIEFHKDEEKSFVTQNELVCYINNTFLLSSFSSSLGHGTCQICC
jgi:hypothetical protein